jgi:thermitase
VTITTLNTGSGYATWSGTSFSAPIVAGTAALVLSVKPSMSASTLVSLLEQNADNIGSSTYFGYGRVNAFKAVTAAQGIVSVPPPVVSVTSPTAGSIDSGMVAVQGTATSSLAVSTLQFRVDNQQVATGSTPSFAFSWNSTTFSNGTHNLTVNAIDSAGNMGTSSVSVNVSNVIVKDTTPPTVAITSPGNGAKVSGVVPIAVSAKDNVSVSQISAYIDGTLKGSATTSPYTYSWNTKKVTSGTQTVKATT